MAKIITINTAKDLRGSRGFNTYTPPIIAPTVVPPKYDDTKSYTKEEQKLIILTHTYNTREKTEKKGWGTIGTRGEISSGQLPYTKNALTLQQIEQGVEDARDSIFSSIDLRLRAVKIAYSYIGQEELPNISPTVEKLQNVGFYDADYQSRLKQENLEKKYGAWIPGYMWCNNFTNMVWSEAFTIGNNLVENSMNTAMGNIWNKTYKTQFTNEKSEMDTKFKLHAGCRNTFRGFQKPFNGRYSITREEAKNGTYTQPIFGTSKFNLFYNVPQPGDMVIVKDGGHIGLVVKVNLHNGKLESFNTIDGNSSSTGYVAAASNGGSTNYIGSNVPSTLENKNVLGFIRLEDNYS